MIKSALNTPFIWIQKYYLTSILRDTYFQTTRRVTVTTRKSGIQSGMQKEKALTVFSKCSILWSGKRDSKISNNINTINIK